MKRLAQPRTAGAILALVVAVCVLFANVSNAASLELIAHSGGAFAQTSARCTNDTLDVAPSGDTNGEGHYNHVTVEGDFGSCSVGNISLYFTNGDHEVLFSATLTLPGSGSSVEVATGSYFEAPASDDGTIVLGLNGWLIPAAWTHAPTAAQAIRCQPVDSAVSAECDVVVTEWNLWTSGYRVEFKVVTSSATAFDWEIEFDLSVTGTPAPGGGTLFPGLPVPATDQWNPSWMPTGFGGSNICSVSTGGDFPKVRIRGSEFWNRSVSASSPATSMGLQVTASGAGIESLACG